MIDLTRKNLDGFDVREFYVQLVNDLKLNRWTLIKRLSKKIYKLKLRGEKIWY